MIGFVDQVVDVLKRRACARRIAVKVPIGRADERSPEVGDHEEYSSVASRPKEERVVLEELWDDDMRS